MKTIILFILLMFLIVSCGDDIPTSPNENIKESAELAATCKSIDKALNETDVESLKELISSNTLTYYESAIEQNTSKLAGFAEVFKTRKLISIDEVYAVYEISYQGKYFEISFSKDDDGNWKLMDF